MPPRFIYFDLGNVLLHFDHPRSCRQMAAAAGVSYESVWKASFEGDLFAAYETGAVDDEEYLERFAALTGGRAEKPALLSACADIFEVNWPILPLVAALRWAGLPLGILSNTNAAHWRHVEARYGVVQMFHTCALSFELGAMKPAAAIYERAAQLAGVRPEEIFFMDDRPENVAGARQAGYDAVLFQSAAELASELRGRGLQFNY